MKPWDFFGITPDAWKSQMEEAGWWVDETSAHWTKDCSHEWVNAGFTSITMVCKHCDLEKN